MTLRISKLPWIAVVAAIVVAGFMTGATASAKSGCSSNGKVTPSYCYPKKFSGTFSGDSECFTWNGSASLTRRGKLTKYLEYKYRGKAKYDWTIKSPSPCVPSGCTITPSTGTINEPVTLAIGRSLTKKGWTYLGDNGAAGGRTSNLVTDCGGGPTLPQPRVVKGSSSQPAFSPGADTNTLRKLAGSRDYVRLNDHYKWSFRGTYK